MHVTKRNKIYYTINNMNDYFNFIKQEMYSDIISLKNIMLFLPEIVLYKSISHTKLIRTIKDNIHLSKKFKGRCSNVSFDYYALRGYEDINEIKEKISLLQKTKSKRCVEYWINQGYNLTDASMKVSELQSKHALKQNTYKNVNWWLENGYGVQDYNEYMYNIKSKNPMCKEYYYNKNIFDDDIINEYISVRADTTSFSALLKRYNNDKVKAMSKYNEISQKKSIASTGSKNPQYGKPAPKGSGRGISGYYKNHYFRSLYEYFAIKHFEENKIPFKDLDVRDTPITVKYTLYGAQRSYRPDFLINDNTIVEVKPKCLINDDIVQLKMKSCIEQFPNYTYKFFTENDMTLDYNMLNDDIKNSIVKIDTGKLHRINRMDIK